jgi:hypothetical protein
MSRTVLPRSSPFVPNSFSYTNAPTSASSALSGSSVTNYEAQAQSGSKCGRERVETKAMNIRLLTQYVNVSVGVYSSRQGDPLLLASRESDA